MARPRRSRGQGLVEFALVAPILILVLLITIDFGRALYGWVVLQNSARIAANYAGQNAEGWATDPDDPVIVNEYRAQILADWNSANCDVPAEAAIPNPAFTDGPDTAVPGGPADTSYDVGDTVVVGLSCPFTPLTPIIGAVVGNSVQLSASAEFRIRSGSVVGLADPTKIPPPPTPTPTPTATPTGTAGPTATPTSTPTGTPSCVVVPDLVHSPGGGTETVADARAEWAAAGFTGTFSPNGQNNKIVQSQTTNPASNPGDCIAASASVAVTHN